MMTTMAARNDDGASTMADSRLSGSDFAYADPVHKILHGDGWLLGLSGPLAVVQHVERCVMDSNSFHGGECMPGRE